MSMRIAQWTLETIVTGAHNSKKTGLKSMLIVEGLSELM